VLEQRAMRRTVPTVSPNRAQTVETVLFRCGGTITRLKPGVNDNENLSRIKNFSDVMFPFVKIIVANAVKAS
jgi:hypothetical protein